MLSDLLKVCDPSRNNENSIGSSNSAVLLEYEELLLNVIAALTNLTFYSCQVSLSIK